VEFAVRIGINSGLMCARNICGYKLYGAPVEEVTALQGGSDSFAAMQRLLYAFPRWQVAILAGPSMNKKGLKHCRRDLGCSRRHAPYL